MQENNILLSEDLKNIILLMDDDETMIELLRKAIDKFEEQNESLRFGLFQFGPLVMRLAHHLNNTDMVEWIFDRRYRLFFSQISSVVIAMDLLFEAGKYNEVLRLFDYALENFKFDIQYPGDFVTLYFASCYKLNTTESFEKAFQLFRKLSMSKEQIKMRGLNFFLTLSIRQKHPNITLEIIETLEQRKALIVPQNLRLLAHCSIDRFSQIINIFQFYLKRDKALNRTKLFLDETLKEIEIAAERNSKEDIRKQIKNLIKNLRESNLVETNQTLDDILMNPIDIVRRNDRQKQAIKN
ncbi:hypothetical protein SSS_02663 [Sarcoptes scabiei]|nr:hypothetical protein SSS_02663 [Sarcoptes scabiei]